jgi:hypothetical protein
LAQAKTQTDWRFPNVKELSSITDKTRNNPAIDVTAFPSTPSNEFWTSTPYAGDSSLAWNVGFDIGYVGGSGVRNDAGHVRLVR